MIVHIDCRTNHYFCCLTKLIMKQFLIVLFSVACMAANAQKKPVSKKPAPVKATASTGTLKTLNDSVSYAIGLSVAKFYQQQGIKNLNTSLVTRAINDVFAGKNGLLTEAQANEAMMRL